MIEQAFQTPGEIELEIRVPAGAVRIEAVETAETRVLVEPLDDAARELLDQVRVESREGAAGMRVTVEVPERKGWGFRFGSGPEFRVEVTCPYGSRLDLRTASADLSARGRLGDVRVKTASGEVEVEDVDGRATIQSASGDVELARVTGLLEVHSASGDVSVGRALGGLKANLVSGDLSVREAAGDVDVNTVSGDQRLESVAGSSITLEAVSGDVEVAIARGANVWLDVKSLSGDTASDLLPGDGAPADDAPVVELRVKTVSGDVSIRRAAAVA